jgi:hypothetical protein
MGREYKIRMPVMERLCGNCGLDYKTHLDGKCLFDSSNFKPGRVKTERKIVKAKIRTPAVCDRCGGTGEDPEHEGACGECQDDGT